MANHNKKYIRWMNHPTNPNVIIGMFSGSDHIGVDYEVEKWTHTIRGNVYEPIELVRMKTNGRIDTVRRVRVSGAHIPFHIDSELEARRACETDCGCDVLTEPGTPNLLDTKEEQ